MHHGLAPQYLADDCVLAYMPVTGGAVTSVGWQITLCDPIDK